jgi:hypothetical protein
MGDGERVDQLRGAVATNLVVVRGVRDAPFPF